MNVKLLGERQRREYAARRLASLPARFRTGGLAVTPQRLAIARVLLSTAEHPSAENVYDIVRRTQPHISLATVHRTLETLCEIGEARKVTCLHDSARYEANLVPHDHVVCIRCRKIRDVEIDDELRALRDLETIGDFRVLGASIEITALCGDCRE